MQQCTSTLDEDESPLAKRSKHLCSYCRMPGHTKTKKGVVTCPKLLKLESELHVLLVLSFYLLVLLELQVDLSALLP